MLDALITTTIATGASIVTSGATWLFARKRYVSEVNSNDIKNMQDSLNFYIKIVEDNTKRIDDYQDEIKELRNENREQRKQMDEQRKQMDEQRRQMSEIVAENTSLKQQLQELKLKIN
jgi:chromosome segregation ATPase